VWLALGGWVVKCMVESLRQAYDYQQSQPGNYVGLHRSSLEGSNRCHPIGVVALLGGHLGHHGGLLDIGVWPKPWYLKRLHPWLWPIHVENACGLYLDWYGLALSGWPWLGLWHYSRWHCSWQVAYASVDFM
jgi:hypothetical protein